MIQATTQTPIPDRLLTAREAAEFLQVPLRTLYSWRVEGTAPPAYRLGKHLRFRRGDLDAWVDARRAA